ncbi:MAG: TlpA family protein disulfide reductase [Bacteroidota bacterium]
MKGALALCFVFLFLLPVHQQAQSTTGSDENSLEAVPPKVRIYNFEELEPIFHKKTDTTYIINFWATWCKPCVAELPYFEALTATYKNEKVKVILVSLDFKKQIETKLIPFLQKHNLQSEVLVLYDPNANTWINKVSPEWSGAIPATVIYNQQKREFHEAVFDDFEQLNSIIKTFLNS